MRVLIFSMLLMLLSCKDYHNDMIDWIDNITIGTDIREVKKEQPKYIEIDWNNPRINGDKKEYLITKIVGNHDLLGMSYHLVFRNNHYVGREAHK